MVIDMQKGFLSPSSPLFVAGAPATVPACIRALELCRGRRIPIFFVTRSYRADGADVERARLKAWREGGKPLSPGCAPELSGAVPAEFGVADYYVVKPRFSAFFATELDMLLRRLGIDTLLLAGTATPNCIRATCYDALSLDYDVIVLADCTSSQTEDIQQSNLRDMVNVGAVVISSSELPEALKEGDGEND
ncbi:MAG: cysteine hydrolase [Synergistes sp.]|nr:cysteine hydrolase [Synergistes sp.]